MTGWPKQWKCIFSVLESKRSRSGVGGFGFLGGFSAWLSDSHVLTMFSLHLSSVLEQPQCLCVQPSFSFKTPSQIGIPPPPPSGLILT